jgi:integrase
MATSLSRQMPTSASYAGYRSLSLKMHAARHTWATLALESGRSIKWLGDQLGHSDPSITLRTYVHALPTQEGDLEFANFGVPERPYTPLGLEDG